jgi:hypothetical protein
MPGAGRRFAPVSTIRAAVAMVVLAWLVAAAPLGAGSAAAAAAPPVRPAAAAVSATSQWNDLYAVSCAGMGACVAVGGQSSGALAEVWNGIAWRIVTVPELNGSTAAQLNAVSCTAANACVAVGYDFVGLDQLPLAEAWNGTSWTIEATANPGGEEMTELTGVSCTRRDACVAVGWYWNSSDVLVTLSEVWNGTSWTIAATPNPTPRHGSAFLLDGVSCTAPDACRAVGDWEGFDRAGAVGAPFAEVWNGAVWKLQSMPNPKGYGGGIPNGISCSGSRGCVAIGHHDNVHGVSVPLAERWDGRAWAIRPLPNPAQASDSYLNGVSCSAAHACTGVGYYYESLAGRNVALAERWDGTSWQLQAPADPTPDSILDAVSCTRADRCVAVGVYYNSSQVGLTLAEAWNGTAWAVQPTPNP